MLKDILLFMKDHPDAISLEGLSQRLDVEESALSGMLETLQQMGKIKRSDDSGFNGDDACDSIRCNTCSGVKSCPFLGRFPSSYTLADQEKHTPGK